MTLRLTICVCSLLFLTTIASSQVKELPPLPEGSVNVGDPAKIKAVLAREDELRQAYVKMDPKLVGDLFADDFLIPVANIWCCFARKDAQIQSVIDFRDLKVPHQTTSITNEQTVVRVYGDTAIVTAVQTTNIVFTEETPPTQLSVRVLFMNVWVLRGGKWLLVSGSRKAL